MRVEIQLQPEAADDFKKQQTETEKSAPENQPPVSKLIEDVEKLGLKLQPTHPNQTHPSLAPFFMIEVPDRQTAELVIDRLSKNRLVEAAYLSPEESLPSM